MFVSVLQALSHLNAAVKNNNRDEMMSILQSSLLTLKKPVSFSDTSLYLKLFKKCLEEKHSDGSELWLEDIEQVTNTVAIEAKNVQSGKKLT